MPPDRLFPGSVIDFGDRSTRHDSMLQDGECGQRCADFGARKKWRAEARHWKLLVLSLRCLLREVESRQRVLIAVDFDADYCIRIDDVVVERIGLAAAEQCVQTG